MTAHTLDNWFFWVLMATPFIFALLELWLFTRDRLKNGVGSRS